MFKNLTLEQKELALAMSEISEKCYCAGWLKNLEYVLWHAVENGERKFGQDSIARSEIDKMKQLSTVTNCWVYINNNEAETAILLDEWKILHHNSFAKDPNIING